MKILLRLDSKSYSVSLDQPLDISIPLKFDGEQPNSYDVPKASAKAYEDGRFVGDTRRGGSCNFEEYRLIPHCNGTHTECVGHLALERISLHSVLKDAFIPATLVTIECEPARQCRERTDPRPQDDDLLLTRRNLQSASALATTLTDFREGLIVRTSPNPTTKKSMRYLEYIPPYFTKEAMEFILQSGVTHLLVDVPSVDRILDQGRMATHHVFWNVPQGSHEVDKQDHSLRTITEMVFVPNGVPDGPYLLNLQVAPFVADAAPSRPILYKIESAQ